jgi:hypothetical protein
MRHFQQFVEAIANAWDWRALVGMMGAFSKVGYVSRGAFGCSTLLKKGAKMRPLKSCGILARATNSLVSRSNFLRRPITIPPPIYEFPFNHNETIIRNG